MLDDLQKKGLCPFTFAIPGDKVFSTIHGYGNIVNFEWDKAQLSVIFDSGVKVWFTLSGFRQKGSYDFTEEQELFWDDELTKKPMMPRSVEKRDRIYTFQPFGG